jgi:hypothetical protein
MSGEQKSSNFPATIEGEETTQNVKSPLRGSNSLSQSPCASRVGRVLSSALENEQDEPTNSGQKRLSAQITESNKKKRRDTSGEDFGEEIPSRILNSDTHTLYASAGTGSMGSLLPAK